MLFRYTWYIVMRVHQPQNSLPPPTLTSPFFSFSLPSLPIHISFHPSDISVVFHCRVDSCTLLNWKYLSLEIWHAMGYNKDYHFLRPPSAVAAPRCQWHLQQPSQSLPWILTYGSVAIEKYSFHCAARTGGWVCCLLAGWDIWPKLQSLCVYILCLGWVHLVGAHNVCGYILPHLWHFGYICSCKFITCPSVALELGIIVRPNYETFQIWILNSLMYISTYV